MKKYAVIGHNISYSLSPLIHSEIYRYLDIDASYGIMDMPVEQLSDNIPQLKLLNGFNITKPHKQNILPYLTDCALESVNTVKIVDGKMYGYSTDGYGFSRDIALQFGAVSGKALVLGAGGVSGVIVDELKAMGMEVYITNRTKSKADEVAAAHGIASVNKRDIAPDLIVNATSCGYKAGENPLCGGSGELEVDISRVKWAYDTIYAPPVTNFLATLSGAKTANGHGMLILQAVQADRILCDVNITDEQEKEIYDIIMRKLNKE